MINQKKIFYNLEKNDKEIKKIVMRFNLYKNNKTKRKLISILSPVIVEYPIFYKYSDKDLCHDFYIFILSRIDKLMSKYSPKDNCKFSTWFSLILNRHLWQFLSLRKHENANKIETEIIDTNLYDKYFVAEKNVEYENNEENFNYDFLNTILNSDLTRKEKKVMIFKFANFCVTPDEDPLFLRKIQKVEMLKERINKNQLSIFKQQKILLTCNSEKKRKKILFNIKRIRKSQENKKKLLDNFHICRSNKWIAAQLNLKISTISSLLLRAKKKLKKEAPIVLFPIVDNEDKKI